MQIHALPLPGLFTLDPLRHGDDRGWFAEVFRTDRFREDVADVRFVQENRSLSAHPARSAVCISRHRPMRRASW